MSALPFHPAYGFADATRLAILKDADTFGVREAAQLHRVHPSTVRKWRRVQKAMGA
jgi:hypothetical protein